MGRMGASTANAGTVKKGRCDGARRERPPEQLALFAPPSASRRGGKRRGAGRKPRGARAGAPHRTRPDHQARHPVHVVLRVVPGVGSLRRRRAYRAIRWATLTAAAREGFRIVHLSIQRTHLHLLVEADDKHTLARGLQGFQVSAARHINRELGTRGGPPRRGTVFPDRYHAVVIRSPRQARHALGYVLSNWRKHGEDRAGLARGWHVDPFSTGILFPDWEERSEEPLLWPMRATYEPLMVYRPRTWLLAEGWKRAGTVSYREVPSAAATK